MISYTEFERICNHACQILENRLATNDKNILGHSGTLFEPDVYQALKKTLAAQSRYFNAE